MTTLIIFGAIISLIQIGLLIAILLAVRAYLSEPKAPPLSVIEGCVFYDAEKVRIEPSDDTGIYAVHYGVDAAEGKNRFAVVKDFKASEKV